MSADYGKRQKIVFVMLILMGAVFFIYQSAINTPEKQMDDLVVRHCKSLVAERLKSPSTASFPENLDPINLGSEQSLFSVVDAQNGFGATVRAKFGCKVNCDLDAQDCELLDLTII